MEQKAIWKEAIREIRLAQRANRLVLFVGAGVSANSGVPTWENLIRLIAAEIGYDNCHRCKKIRTDVPGKTAPIDLSFLHRTLFVFLIISAIHSAKKDNLNILSFFRMHYG